MLLGKYVLILSYVYDKILRKLTLKVTCIYKKARLERECIRKQFNV